MFTSVHIKSFRSCVNTTIDNISDMTALVGRNGVGKTTLLKAIEMASRVASSKTPQIPFPDEAASIALEFELDGRIFQYKYELESSRIVISATNEKPEIVNALLSESLCIKTDTDLENIFERRGEVIELGHSKQKLRTGHLTSASYAIQQLLPNESSLPLLTKVDQFLSKVKYYPFEELAATNDTGVMTNAHYDEWRIGPKTKFSADKQLIFKILDLFLENKPRFKELCTLAGAGGLNIINKIEVEDFTFPLNKSDTTNPPTTYYFITFAPSHQAGGKIFDFSSLSFGTRRLIRLIVAMLHDGSSVFLVEQPEDGIHIGLINKLIPTLRSYSSEGQIIITTHSSDVLNAFKPQEVRFVEMNEGLTTVRGLSSGELIAARNYMQQEGPLAEFVQSVQGT